MSERRRVVVTGLGAITPLGTSVPEFWDALIQGKSGGGLITRFDTAGHKVVIACEVKNFDPDNFLDKRVSRKMDVFVQFALIAAKEAMEDSGISVDDVGSEEFGVIIGSGIGGLPTLEENNRILIEKGPDRVSPMMVPRMIANMAAGQVSITFTLKGPNTCPVTACATSTNAIGDAAAIIARGQAKAMLAGGAECTITPLGIAGFANMKALSHRNDSPQTASRPFSGDRDGFVMGEGAGVLVLEEYEYAKARGARIYGEVIGYGMTSDAHHITAPAPEGEGAQRSMRMAIKDAGITTDDIDYINAHGTSTPLNDKLESIAVKHVFGDRANQVPMSSIKGAIGHLLGAAGGVEAVASLLTLRDQIIPPTINYTGPDEDCTLDYVTEGARKAPVRTILSNSFGFGGHNATIVLRKVE